MQQVLYDLEVKMESNDNEKKCMESENLQLDMELQGLNQEKMELITQL